jgi:hypothetical protein
MVGVLYFYFYRRIFFRDVGDSVKKYKITIFKRKPSKFGIFWPSFYVSNPDKSDLCKNHGAEYLKLLPL